MAVTLWQRFEYYYYYSQVGSFPLWSLREGVRRARFRLMSDVDAGIDEAAVKLKRRWLPCKQKASRAITKKELDYLLSRRLHC